MLVRREVHLPRLAARLRSPILRPLVHYPHIVKQRGISLRGKGMVALQEHAQGRTAGPGRDLGMHPDILLRLVPGLPGDRRCFPVLATGQVHTQRQLHRRLALHVLAPGLNLVAVPRDGLCTLEDARLSADKVTS